ncbi:hypothetical protein K440DRAFT_654906 [Wilcoxina mikolae CBS 423.85]|nr:hypothetical protein K440DRAFT_654906 [Wilcoxina mikolae CBS 423.85]
MLSKLIVVSLGFVATLANCAAIPAAVLPRASFGKKGLAYNDANLCSKFSSDGITWAYDWGQSPQGSVQGREYVPLLWGPKMYSTWAKNAEAAISKGANHLLGMNEPDIPSQSDLSPETAAAAYRTYMQPFAGKAKLGAPAVTNSGTPGQGLSWLKSFLAVCSDCTIDFVPIHWYDPTGGIEYFKKHMTEAKDVAGGRKVWLTEFGVPGASQEIQAAFLKAVEPWLDAQDWIERYAYFGVFEGNLVQGGELSLTGLAYNL